MNDTTTTIQDLKDQFKQFVHERNWEQFHNHKSTSMNIVAEAAELMEIFMWVDNVGSQKVLEDNRQAVEDEVADIMFALFDFCNHSNIDITQAVAHKMVLTAQKYPPVSK